MAAQRDNKRILRNASVLGAVALAWLAIDALSKHWADQGQVGELIGAGIPGIFDFRLIHNTGAAWGMLDDSTFALGIFAVIFCALLLLLAHLRREKASVMEMVGFGMVLAGGIGNAIDRFANGYVVDFIETTFIDFPVFNVADIGVTCGFVILGIAYFFLDGQNKEGE